MDNITLSWLDNVGFEAEIQGHKILLDMPVASGGDNRGPTPKPLMLVALAGCTALDVISLMRKMRVDFTDFKVSAEAEKSTEIPVVYTGFKLVYTVTGSGLDAEKVSKAVNLSAERYCGVMDMLRKVAPIDIHIEINQM